MGAYEKRKTKLFTFDIKRKRKCVIIRFLDTRTDRNLYTLLHL